MRPPGASSAMVVPNGSLIHRQRPPLFLSTSTRARRGGPRRRRAPTATSLGSETQRLPSSPLFAVAPRGSGAPLPARHTAFVGASRRKPPRLSGACAKCRCAGSALDASPPSRVASCAGAWSAADLTPGGCGPGSGRAAGAASALGPRLDLHGSPGALQRPHWGGARFRVSPGACRCCPLSCGSGSNPSPRPSQRRGRVALCRHRGLPLRLQAPPNGERQVLRPRVKAEPFGWPGGQPRHGCSTQRSSSSSCRFVTRPISLMYVESSSVRRLITKRASAARLRRISR